MKSQIRHVEFHILPKISAPLCGISEIEASSMWNSTSPMWKKNTATVSEVVEEEGLLPTQAFAAEPDTEMMEPTEPEQIHL